MADGVRDFYIASVKCYMHISVTGVILVSDGEEFWLGKPESGMGIGGNGAGECRTRPEDATLFNSIDYLKQQWKRYDASPYCCRIKPDSLRIFKLTATEVVDAGD